MWLTLSYSCHALPGAVIAGDGSASTGHAMACNALTGGVVDTSVDGNAVGGGAFASPAIVSSVTGLNTVVFNHAASPHA